ncbi:hypothetical protein Ndes2526B_g08232 [Nannochloris sp. 'desiccata']|nr:hypothetical protein KSW81_001706 [Chlorella desiccata (nom. nud.)]KAH7616135.1 putative Mitochondrial uncoupling protein 3 [Chlorella desiccata (nom. nud.)]
MADKGTTWGKLCLSAISAGSAETTTYPLDFIKTRLQMHQAHVPQPLVTTVTTIIRQEGFKAMYAGVSAAVLRHLPYTSIRVSTFESLRNWAQRRENTTQISLPSLLVFGMFSGALGQAAAVPADLIKIRLQSCSLEVKPSLLATFQQIVRQEGIIGLWRGSTPAIQRAALVNLGELTTYDIAKRNILHSGVLGTGKDTLLVHVASSMCSGFVSAAVSTPADVVKTRLMSQDPVKPQFSGMVDCFQKTVEKEGVRGLYKGFLPTWARLGPWQLTFWVTFEQLRILQGMDGF